MASRAVLRAAGQRGERRIGAERRDARRVPLRRRAHAERAVAFDDEQAQRPVAAQLHDEAAVELERGGEQRAAASSSPSARATAGG